MSTTPAPPKRRLTDPELIANFLPAFLGACRRDLGNAQLAIEGHDLCAPMAIGHRLKGTGATFGVPEISCAGAALERAARAGDRAAAISALFALARVLEEAEAGLTARVRC